MKDAELAKDQLVKAEKDEINMPDDKKLQQATRKASQKFHDCMEKAKSLDATYQTSVKKANETIQTFQTDHMPKVLDVRDLCLNYTDV
jgi:hypothetical protein